MVQDDFHNDAVAVIQTEIQALTHLKSHLPPHFSKACQLIRETKGKVIVTGVGKSGHIGRKIASTLASTGTTAIYLHPGEAGHGDLGVIDNSDLLLAISYSGQSEEILTFLPLLKRRSIPIIAITSEPFSSLAQLADVHLQIEIHQEACPHNLAPTTSTTTTLVLGDALAIALLKARGFTREDFAATHPAGRLGKQLLTLVKDIMRTGSQLALVSDEEKVTTALIEISRKRLGMAAVVRSNGELCGIFTDGDLRRMLEKKLDIHQVSIRDVMTPNCLTIDADVLAIQAVQLMEKKQVNGLIVTNKQHHPIGMFNMHDLLESGIL